MKKLCVFLSLLFASIAFQGCDSKPTEVVKEIHDTDTIYTDRFAHKSTVVWGEWTVRTTTDTTATDAVFLQDTSSVTAYIYWKSGTWVLTGSVLDTTLNLLSSGSPMVMMNGSVKKVAGGKVTSISGTALAQGSSQPINWTAQRKM